MNGRILVGLFLCSLFLVVGGDAQSPDIPFSGYMRADGEKPIWALEFIKVQPENFAVAMRSEEHTSELQSHSDLVCRLLLEKKKKKKKYIHNIIILEYL